MKTVMTMIKPINLLFAWHGLLAGSYFVAYATAEMSLRMHRSGVAAYAKAMTSMLGRLFPAPPSKAKH